MATTIRLTVLTGPHRNRRYCFCGPTSCQVGRALDCFVRMAGSDRDSLISRHHCQLEIKPPLVQIGDLGSINGTYINGKSVEPSRDPKAIFLGPEYPGREVNDGDILNIGGTTFQVDVVDCPHTMNDENGKPTWEAGETAKADCPITC
jgi:eukaryotic-like serine/threonine-protein kinase